FCAEFEKPECILRVPVERVLAAIDRILKQTWAMTPIAKHRAVELLGRIADRNVVVLGDVMLDEFLWGEVTRISPEAPVPVVDIRRESTHLGGAANVLANLVALGVRACVVGVLGDDFAGERIRTSVRDKSD